MALCVFGILWVMAGWWLASRGGHNGPPPAVSVLVLPVTNSTGDAERTAFCRQLDAEISKKLAQVQGVTVSAPLPLPPDPQQANKALEEQKKKVNGVLSGALSGTSGTLQLSAQLSDGGSGYRVWSHSYQAGNGDAAALADEVVSGLTTVLPGRR